MAKAKKKAPQRKPGAAKTPLKKTGLNISAELEKPRNIIIFFGIVFVALMLLYKPIVFEGLDVQGSDVVSNIGNNKQILEFEKETGKNALWNPYMFDRLADLVPAAGRGGCLFVGALLGIERPGQHDGRHRIYSHPPHARPDCGGTLFQTPGADVDALGTPDFPDALQTTQFTIHVFVHLSPGVADPHPALPDHFLHPTSPAVCGHCSLL